MVPITNMPMPEGKWGLKCPYGMTPTRVVIHNTANDATARNEVRYMQSNHREGGFHYAVDDVEIIQGIALDRNAWNAGDGTYGKGNREGIAIEICYSKSGGGRFEQAQANAAELTAKLLRDYGWGIDRVTKHQDYSGKNCPHRTLSDYGWDHFLALVQGYLTGGETPTHPPVEAPPTGGKVTAIYRVRTQKHGWLPEVTDLADYAGWEDSPITDVAIRVDKGSIRYRAHVKGGGWLPYVTGYNTGDGANGYAGNGRPMDAVEVYYYTPDGIRPYKRAKYRVAPVGGGYYPWQYDDETALGQDGYAGSFGREIGKLQISIE